MTAGRRTLSLAALLLAAVCSTRSAPAQQANFHHYTNSDGLPQRQTLTVYQDRAGFIWFGTYGGLSRYDGAAFRTFTTDDGLSANVVQALTEDAAGRLVVGTIGGGVCLLDGGRFECLREAEGLADDNVADLLADRDGGVWVATEGGLSYVHEGRAESFGEAHGLPRGAATSLARDGEGTLWVGTSSAVARRIGARFEVVASGLPPVRALAVTGGELLVGTESGLWHRREEELVRHPVPEALAEAFVGDVTPDPHGGTWVATRAGVLHLDGAEQRWLRRRNGLISDLVYVAMVDREGNVWFGTDAGTSKLVPGPFETFGEDSGLPHLFVRALAVDSENRIWAGTRAGVGVLEGDRFSAITLADGLVHDRIYSLAPFGERAMLIGTLRGLVEWRNGAVRRTFTERGGLPADQVASLEADGKGGVWIGTTLGLAHLSPGGAPRRLAHPAIDGRYIMAMRLDPEGRLWLGTRSGGLAVLDGETVTVLGEEDGITEQTIWSLDVDRDGRMWAGTNGDGLFGVRGDDVVHLTTDDGLVNDFVWQVLCDSRGAVWAYTNQGLDRWDGVDFVHYGLDDGLVDLEGSANAALEDRRGNLWLGTASGVVRYVPGRSTLNRVPPQIVLRAVASERDGALSSGSEIAFGSGPLSFDFTGLSFRQERSLEYRHRLLGLSDSWSEPSPERTIRFGSLPPGDYEFQVLARNAAGIWSEDPATFRFTVLPAFWHRVWFRIGAAIGLAASIALAVAWRTRRLEAERHRLESLVARHTADLRRKTEHLEREVESRREAERALKLSEERVRDILEHSSNLFYSHTVDHVLTYVSPQTRSFFDCEPEEALRRWTEFATDHPINDKGFEITQRAIETGEPQPPYELELEGAAGRRIWVQVSEAPVVKDGETVAIVGALTDITDAKRAEEARRKFEDRLHQGQRLEAVGRLAGGVAHDFNNLLTTILGYAELLSDRISDDPEMASDVAEIRHAGESAALLTQQLLAFSRKQVVRAEVLDVNRVVTSAVSLLRPLIGEDVELRTRLDPGLGPVEVDRGQLEQILVNLAVNARDAMPAGGCLTISTSDRTVASSEGSASDDGRGFAIEPGRYACLEVSDDGVGMDEETSSHVFEPFFSTKQPGHGTGLGLATVYGIVKQSEGYVWVESEVGRGSAFTVYLPVTDQPLEAEPEATAPSVAPSVADRTVLLVEDDDAVRSLAARTLRKAGLEVLEAPDGQAALEVSGRHPGTIDLLLTDVVMPGLNGREVAEHLRRARPEIKVLFMSGYPDDVLNLRQVSSEALDFLAKPFDAEKLLREVRSALGC